MTSDGITSYGFHYVTTSCDVIVCPRDTCFYMKTLKNNTKSVQFSFLKNSGYVMSYRGRKKYGLRDGAPTAIL